MPIDDATWANVRRAYVDTSKPVKQICAEFGIDGWALAARARQEHWPRRLAKIIAARAAAKAAVRSLKPAQAAAVDPTPSDYADLPLPSNQRARLTLVRRLYKAIDTKLKQMETHMASATGTSSADHERETRTLSTLIRNFERVSEFDSDLAKSTGTPANSSTPAHFANHGANTAAATSATDADRLRRDIAERLVRLHEQRSAPRDSG
jgi:hypothetical protein